MYLLRTQIEEIAVAVMKDFNDFFFNEQTGRKKGDLQGTPIDQFAKDYLGLSVSFAHLSSDGNLCGLTAYADTEFVLEENGQSKTIFLKQNQVILDMSFITPGQVRNLCGKRRFTLAHECAHQILYQMQSEDGKTSCRKKYAAHTAYSLRDLKTKEDWNEWQANVLGAAILMPQEQIDRSCRSSAPVPSHQTRGRAPSSPRCRKSAHGWAGNTSYRYGPWRFRRTHRWTVPG